MADPIKLAEELKQGTNENYKKLDKRIQDALMMFFYPCDHSHYQRVLDIDGVIEAWYIENDNADGTDWNFDTFTTDEWITKCGFKDNMEFTRILNFL